MFVCCVCCVLSGRGLCDELIIHPEEFYLCGASSCVITKRGGHNPRWAAEPEMMMIMMMIIITIIKRRSFKLKTGKVYKNLKMKQKTLNSESYSFMLRSRLKPAR
jgi:hypothetical protein